MFLYYDNLLYDQILLYDNNLLYNKKLLYDSNLLYDKFSYMTKIILYDNMCMNSLFSFEYNVSHTKMRVYILFYFIYAPMYVYTY